MFCSNCGKKIGDDAKFCDNCGNAIAVEQLGTNTSVKVSTKKANKKLPVILGVCVVVIILIAISISVLGKKADKVTKIVKAYENTINAESFNIHVIHSEGFRYIYEVFGKGDLEDTYIARYDIRGDFNDVKYNYEDYLDELAHGDYAGGYEYELLAKRDFAGLWDREFGDEIGLPYDTAYNFAIDIASDYLKDRDNNTGVKVDIEDNRYSVYLETDELENVAEKSEYDDDVEEFLEELKESECQGVRCEVILEDEYIQSIALYFSRNGGEIQVIGIEFDSVNELTKETSMAYKLFNELQEEEKAFDEAVSEMEDWQSAYVSALEDGTIVVSEFCKYALRDLDADGIPELFCYDDSIRSTYLYAFADGSIREVVCRWGGFLINDNLLYSDDNYENAIVYEYSSGKVEELFIAQHDENDDSYYYEGNALSYEEMANIAKEYFGTDLDWETRTLELDFEYDQDSISQAIVENSIAPVASISEDEQQVNVIEDEVIPAYENYIRDVEGYSLVYIDADEIPELITRTASWYNIYTYNNGVVDSGLAPNTFEIIEKENLIHTTEGHGVFYDYIVSIKNGVFESCAEGRYGDVYDAEGNYIPDVYEYSWNGQQVNEDEYNNLLSNAFDSGKAKSMYDIEFYSSIQEAYENLGKFTFSECGGYITELEMINNSLTVKTEEGKGISYPIDENCEWLEMGSDGTIYGNHSFETLKEAIARERELYIEAPEFYESPLVLRIEIQNDTIIKICTSTP